VGDIQGGSPTGNCHGVDICIAVQNYESLYVSWTHGYDLVNTQTHTYTHTDIQLLTAYTIGSAR